MYVCMYVYVYISICCDFGKFGCYILEIDYSTCW